MGGARVHASLLLIFTAVCRCLTACMGSSHPLWATLHFSPAFDTLHQLRVLGGHSSNTAHVPNANLALCPGHGQHMGHIAAEGCAEDGAYFGVFTGKQGGLVAGHIPQLDTVVCGACGQEARRGCAEAEGAGGFVMGSQAEQRL